ncbi:hypothetical protein ABPG74_009917 [Tetrahymena malaccensis]
MRVKNQSQQFESNYFSNRNAQINGQQNFHHNQSEKKFQFKNNPQNNNISPNVYQITSPRIGNLINQQNGQNIQQQSFNFSKKISKYEQQNNPQLIYNLNYNNNNFELNNMGETKQFFDYKIYLQQKLGEGQYGKVCLCLDNKDQKYYACKMILIGNHEDVLKEMYVAQQIKGDYICKLYFAGISQKYLYLMTEYCPQGTLSDYIRQTKLSLNQIMMIFFQIIYGYYQSLYKQNIIHRDIKLENILMKEDIPKITDFGFGKFLDDVNLSIEHSYKCTPLYAAPQIYCEDTNKYSYKADIYSLGVLLYQMTNNLQNPNQIQSEMRLLKFHQSNRINGIEKTLVFQSQTLDKKIKELIYKMMKYNEDDRISIEQLVNETQYIVFNQHQSVLIQK